MRHLPYSGLLEPLVYFGILLFNLTLTFWIGETLLGLVGVMIFIPVAMLLLIHVGDGRRRATDQDLVAHARDYGREPPAGEPFSARPAATRRSA